MLWDVAPTVNGDTSPAGLGFRVCVSFVKTSSPAKLTPAILLSPSRPKGPMGCSAPMALSSIFFKCRNKCPASHQKLNKQTQSCQNIPFKTSVLTTTNKAMTEPIKNKTDGHVDTGFNAGFNAERIAQHRSEGAAGRQQPLADEVKALKEASLSVRPDKPMKLLCADGVGERPREMAKRRPLPRESREGLPSTAGINGNLCMIPDPSLRPRSKCFFIKCSQLNKP